MKPHIPRRRFGQNFLVDRNIIEAIVAAIAPSPGETVVEIGPGFGALTQPLLERLPSLHVIEIDRDLVARLRDRYPADRLVIHEGDVLDFDFGSLPAPFRLVGNLPYNISTELLFRIVPVADCLTDAHFMLQREVVERMVAPPSTAAYGRLSVMLQYRFEMKKLIDVPPSAFRPAPKVESAVVRLIPRPRAALAEVDQAALARAVTTAFTKRRKTLRNALAGLIEPEALRELGIDPQLRPENLGVAEYVAIANAIAPARA